MISKAIEDFLAFLRDAEQLYHISTANEQEANGETQGILHSLELQEHTYNEYARLSKGLAEIRKKRRAAKDLMDATAPVLEWLDENRSVVKRLERLLGDVRKAEKRSEGRIYTPRANKAKL